MCSFLGTCHDSYPSGQELQVQIEELDTSSSTRPHSNTWTSVLFRLCIGLVSTVPGGVLTGQMMVVTAQILETVGEDGPLMEALGLTLLGIIKGMITVLDPWPLLGAVMGVAGAAGLALSAAGTEAHCYGQAGRVGAMLGATVGAFLGSWSYGGVSSTFIALSAALIPAFNQPAFFFKQKDA
ncbi:unnamed protein product [Arctogadus glacialis]